MPLLGHVLASNFPSPLYFTVEPVALHAAVNRGCPAFNDFAEDVVKRADEASGFRVMRSFKLGDLFLVAPVAVVRRDDHGDLLAVVIEGRRIALVGLVARVAIDTGSIMRAVLPLIDDARRSVLVALQTLLSLRRNRHRFPGLRATQTDAGNRDQ